MWTDESRYKYERKGLRYPSDLTDEEWALVEPHLPPPRQRSRFASPDRREVLNAILYVLSTGCQWRALPKGLPAKSTVHDYFVDWHGDGTLTRIHHALYGALRELEGKAVRPTTSPSISSRLSSELTMPLTRCNRSICDGKSSVVAISIQLPRYAGLGRRSNLKFLSALYLERRHTGA